MAELHQKAIKLYSGLKAKYEEEDEEGQDKIKSAVTLLDEDLGAAFIEGEMDFECAI